MSLAYTTRAPVELFDVSARTLYYCVAGGRTCKTGWGIPEALRALELIPGLMLPSKCFDKALQTNSLSTAEPDISDFASICGTTTVRSNDPECVAITRKPRYSCRFKSLSSFWQIQQHIRTYGSVITRIAMYDDFNVQFNSSAAKLTGMELPPYRRNTTAKLQYGHAALIVGYDNTNFTWTVLNSWGSGTDPSNPRKIGGITKDGMFRIRMGVAGVGTPDFTYGVMCEPTDGSIYNLHNDKPWLRKARLPLQPIREQPIGESKPFCYTYTMKAHDTLAYMADHFGLEISQVVKSNLQLFETDPNTTFKYQTTLTPDEMKQTLQAVYNVTQRILDMGAIEPYFMCTYFDASGKDMQVRCDMARLESEPSTCTRRGTVACNLLYSDVNVTQPAPGSIIRVCNPDWSDTRVFNKVAYEVGSRMYLLIPEQQEVALRRVLQVIDPRLNGAEASSFIECSNVDAGTDWTVRKTYTTRSRVRFSLAVACSNGATGGEVEGLYFQVLSRAGRVDNPRMHPDLGQQLVQALLDLLKLYWLYIYVYGGTLAPQLGVLNLRFLSVNHYCMYGPLPPNLLYGWPELYTLIITRQGDALGFRDPVIGTCGISGPVPQEWQNTLRRDTATQLPQFLTNIDLSGNLLSGSLPEIIGGERAIHSMRNLQLQRNRFTGYVPEAWAKLEPLDEKGRTVIQAINIQQNLLEGPLPTSLRTLEDINNTLGASVQPGEEGMTLQKNHPLGEQQGYCRVSVSLIDGIEYITAIEVGTLSFGADAVSAAGLNLKRLPPLLRMLPQLTVFDCSYCNMGSAGRKPLTNKLPDNLPSAAPQLMKLALVACDIVGSVPPSFGNMKHLQELNLFGNRLTGSLPPELAELNALQVLLLSYNKLDSTLPGAWAAMPKELYVDLQYNINITGTIPASFASNTGTYFNFYGTSISGCRPRGLQGNFYTQQPLPNGSLSLRELPLCG
ncbi:hypothetical protein OEZ86_005004 [Tetradesmus obliquus]|nr:hypothetical protein OEZ86_005004 [Tetradesmus obliquus]